MTAAAARAACVLAAVLAAVQGAAGAPWTTLGVSAAADFSAIDANHDECLKATEIQTAWAHAGGSAYGYTSAAACSDGILAYTSASPHDCIGYSDFSRFYKTYQTGGLWSTTTTKKTTTTEPYAHIKAEYTATKIKGSHKDDDDDDDDDDSCAWRFNITVPAGGIRAPWRVYIYFANDNFRIKDTTGGVLAYRDDEQIYLRDSASHPRDLRDGKYLIVGVQFKENCVSVDELGFSVPSADTTTPTTTTTTTTTTADETTTTTTGNDSTTIASTEDTTNTTEATTTTTNETTSTITPTTATTPTTTSRITESATTIAPTTTATTTVSSTTEEDASTTMPMLFTTPHSTTTMPDDFPDDDDNTTTVSATTASTTTTTAIPSTTPPTTTTTPLPTWAPGAPPRNVTNAKGDVTDLDRIRPASPAADKQPDAPVVDPWAACPQCRVYYADDICQPQCASAVCLFDGDDCARVPECPEAATCAAEADAPNGVCVPQCNTPACGFVDPDCRHHPRHLPYHFVLNVNASASHIDHRDVQARLRLHLSRYLAGVVQFRIRMRYIDAYTRLAELDTTVTPICDVDGDVDGDGDGAGSVHPRCTTSASTAADVLNAKVAADVFEQQLGVVALSAALPPQPSSDKGTGGGMAPAMVAGVTAGCLLVLVLATVGALVAKRRMSAGRAVSGGSQAKYTKLLDFELEETGENDDSDGTEGRGGSSGGAGSAAADDDLPAEDDDDTMLMLKKVNGGLSGSAASSGSAWHGAHGIPMMRLDTSWKQPGASDVDLMFIGGDAGTAAFGTSATAAAAAAAAATATAPRLAPLPDSYMRGEALLGAMRHCVVVGDAANLRHTIAQQGPVGTALWRTDQPEGRALLQLACNTNSEACVSVMLAAGCPADMADSDGRTPLHVAAGLGREGMVRELLRYGASIEAADAAGATPLMLAARSGQQGSLQVLLDHGAKRDAADVTGRTALHWAAASNSTECVQALIAAGANVDQPDKRDVAPLHSAVREGHVAVVRLLLNGFAKRTQFTNELQTPLDLARAGGDEELVALLTSIGPGTGSVKPQQLQQQAKPMATPVTARRVLTAVERQLLLEHAQRLAAMEIVMARTRHSSREELSDDGLGGSTVDHISTMSSRGESPATASSPATAGGQSPPQSVLVGF